MTQVVNSEKGRKRGERNAPWTSGELSLEKKSSDWLLSRQLTYLAYFIVLKE